MGPAPRYYGSHRATRRGRRALFLRHAGIADGRYTLPGTLSVIIKKATPDKISRPNRSSRHKAREGDYEGD
jgi:hypothetical protein